MSTSTEVDQPGAQAVPGDLAADRPLTDDATAGEIATAAGRHRQAAAAAGQRAARDRAEAEELLEAARAEAARILAGAEAEARPLAASGAEAEKEAGALAERARLLDVAAGYAAKAGASDARVKALEDERDTLAAAQADLGRRLADLAAQARDLEPQLAAALDSGDIDTISSLRTRLDAIRALEDALRGQQAPLLARLAEIGDGEMSPIWPQRELAEARRVAGIDRHGVRGTLNAALPGRPAAVADRAARHERLLDLAESDRLAAEAAERKRAQPRTFVHL